LLGFYHSTRKFNHEELGKHGFDDQNKDIGNGAPWCCGLWSTLHRNLDGNLIFPFLGNPAAPKSEWFSVHL
jgi:hypothetical protein